MSEQQETQQTANAQQNNTGGEDNAAKGGTQTTYTQEQLDSMVQAREQRASNAALKSYFAQQGMTEEEITQAINTYKTNREKNKPDVSAMQAQIEQYKQSELTARLNQQATLTAFKLGISADTVPYILKLADFSGVTDESGKINDEKLKSAVSKVLEDVPQLKGETSKGGF
uniref:hypothetical protein n=1 Tax=Pseudoruminococcus massiliensis TaxID=2086583 RepID=UPI003FF01D03